MLEREILDERALLLRNAPDLVELKPFYIPIYSRTRRRPRLVRAGLTLYAILGGLRKQVRFRKVPRSDWEALDERHFGALDKSELAASVQKFMWDKIKEQKREG